MTVVTPGVQKQRKSANTAATQDADARTGLSTPLTPCRMPKGFLEPFVSRAAMSRSSAAFLKLLSRVGSARLPA